MKGILDEHMRMKYAHCTHRLSMRMSDEAYRNYKVTGKHESVEPEFRYCSSMRDDGQPCGEDAVLFEPIKPKDLD